MKTPRKANEQTLLLILFTNRLKPIQKYTRHFFAGGDTTRFGHYKLKQFPPPFMAETLLSYFQQVAARASAISYHLC